VCANALGAGSSEPWNGSTSPKFEEVSATCFSFSLPFRARWPSLPTSSLSNLDPESPPHLIPESSPSSLDIRSRLAPSRCRAIALSAPFPYSILLVLAAFSR
ncbi:hypothetical protein B0H12DRAFT_1140183, partial [Mycena haematopus]